MSAKRPSRRTPPRSSPDTATPRGASFFALGGGLKEGTERADVVLAGVPSAEGSSGRGGVAEAPAVVRALSHGYGGYSQTFGLSIFDELEVADCGDVDPRRGVDGVSDWAEARTRAGQIIGLVGGSQLITLGALRGLVRAKKRAVGLLHFGAHHGLDAYDDERGALALVASDKVAAPKRVMQVGIRGPFSSPRPHALALASGFEVLHTDDVLFDVHAAVTQIREFCRRGRVYVSFDLSVVDPGGAPGATRPSPGGLSVWAAQQLVRAIAGADIAGFDIVGYAPPHDPGAYGGLAVVSILHEILAAIAESHRPVESLRRKKPPSGRRSA